jgi:hypothetical protein
LVWRTDQSSCPDKKQAKGRSTISLLLRPVGLAFAPLMRLRKAGFGRLFVSALLEFGQFLAAKLH